MKKQLKEELIALAEKIIQSKQEEQVNSLELKKLALQLYEKLTLLHFTESAILGTESFSEPTDRSEEENSVESVPVTYTDNYDLPEEEHDEYAPDGTQYNDQEGLMEPNTEKIKDIVAQMPPEAQEVDDMLEYILPRRYMKNDMEDIGGVHYDQLPQFEPVHRKPSIPEKKTSFEPEKSREREPQKPQSSETGKSRFPDQQEKMRFHESENPRSINDRLKKGIQIGINDRIAFVRHLFDGSTSDYNRVLSQLNTLKSREEAKDFVLQMVKPDYNNWEGKEEYEHRFLDIVENRFD